MILPETTILVDTGVWSRHFRSGDPDLVALLHEDLVVTHAWVVGELALGPGLRLDVLGDLEALRRVTAAGDEELLAWIRLHRIRQVGWVDAQLVLSALQAGVRLWTTDRALADLALRLDVGWTPEPLRAR